VERRLVSVARDQPAFQQGAGPTSLPHCPRSFPEKLEEVDGLHELRPCNPPTGHYNGFIAIEAEKQCHAVARIWRVWTPALVDKVADIREYTVTQVHSQQACSVSGAKLRFKPLEDIGR